MKRSLLALVPALAVAVVIGGCNGKKEEGPVSVNSYTEYTDEILKFSIRYPTDWAKGIQAGTQAVFYSSQAVAESFNQFEPKGQRGAKIHVHAIVGGEPEMQASINELQGLFNDPSVLKAPEQVSLNGNTATKIRYEFEVEDTRFTAERYYVARDGAVTYLETAVIGTYDNYAQVFDSARASFRPAAVASRPVDTSSTSSATPADTQLVDAPSADTKNYSNQHFAIQYPGNFSPGSAQAGGAMASVNFAGARNDSYFQIDVIDPKGMELSAIVEQNKRNYGGRSAAATSVGTHKGFVFSYNGSREVTSRAYFLLAGGKLYRITMNWYTPQQELYQPAFQKALASFQAK